MSEPQAIREARKLLEDYYEEPVYPLSHVCSKLDSWIAAMQELARRARALGQSNFHGAGYVDLLGAVRLDISKSNLLWRLLYAKQPLRHQACPVHQGSWSGLPLGIRPACGCDLTGWLA